MNKLEKMKSELNKLCEQQEEISKKIVILKKKISDEETKAFELYIQKNNMKYDDIIQLIESNKNK